MGFSYIGHLKTIEDATPALVSYSVGLATGFGKISPTLAGGQLVAGASQQWIINAPNSRELTLGFSAFQFVDNGCSTVISVYDDAKLLYSGCEASDELNSWLFATSGKAIINVTTSVTATVDFIFTWSSDNNLYHCGQVLGANTFLDDAMVLTDGSSSFTSMRQGDVCTFEIAPWHAGQITLAFEEVDLLFNGETPPMTVWDSDGFTELWNVDLTSVMGVVPPPIVSAGNSLFLRYASPGSNAVSAYGGFRGSYYVEDGVTTRGEGDRLTVLKMSSALGIAPPGNTGVSYPALLNYSWLIEPKTLVSSTITFAFSALNLTDCNDVLTLYDGSTTSSPVLGQYCGGQPPTSWIKSGSAALLTLQTNSALEAGTFELNYFADGPNYHCGFIRNAALLTAASFTITDGSSSTESMYQNQFCTWNISPHGSTGVALFFSRFDLGGGSLTIYDGDVDSGIVYAVISAVAAVPVPIYLPNRTTVGIEYSSSSSGSRGTGFSLTYFGDSESFVGPGDGVIALASSTVHTMVLPKSSSGFIVPGVNLTWLITPDTTGTILFSFARLNLSDCSRTWLVLYEGLNADPSAELGVFCGDFSSVLDSPLQHWIATSQSTARIDLVSLPSELPALPDQGFDFGYYADGPNNHCGFVNNPASLTSPSFIITDGSPTEATIYPGQDCEWVIDPSVSTEDITNSSSLLNRIVIEFMDVDLGGGSLIIYDGPNSSSPVLYSCVGCSVTPRPLISSSQSVFVHYTSDYEIGSGFQLMYYTSVGTEDSPLLDLGLGSAAKVLEIPVGQAIDQTEDNTTLAFRLGVPLTGASSVLTAAPRYSILSIDAVGDTVIDGRTGTLFPSQTSDQQICGVISSEETSYFADLDSVQVAATQALDGYLYATRRNTLSPSARPTARPTTVPTRNPSAVPTVANLNPTAAPFTPFPTALPTAPPTTVLPSSSPTGAPSSVPSLVPSSAPSTSPTALFDNYVPKSLFALSSNFDHTLPDIVPLTSSTTCKYVLDSANTMAINIRLERFTVQHGGRVRIFTGVYGNDLLAFDSSGLTNEILNVNIVAPCGLATILVDSGANFTLGETEPEFPDYGLQLSYAVDERDFLDEKFACLTYIDSLTPEAKKVDPLLPLYYLLAAIVIMAVLGVCGIKLYKIQQEYVFNFKTKKRVKKIEAHPRFTPKLDEFRNRFLPMGTCVICGDGPQKMLSIGKCSHALCLDCMKSYLVNALGDISQFPVKCPMHYEGCTLHVEARLAKRVLIESQYNRFLEFHDRSVHGDGMRCVFCNNFVSVEATANQSMVECPFCIQKFCMRCKKPWHYEGKCPLETADDSLEQWKKDSGAQKCPVCSKTIEKSDADTCNHMIHKITDGIPCIRERTDFCCKFNCPINIINNYINGLCLFCDDNSVCSLRSVCMCVCPFFILDCCGEEVLGDYPHDEVANPGVNHFPDGVFQKCLKIMQREREAERERLKKIKRQRNNAKGRMQARNENVVLPTGADWDEPASPKPITGGGGLQGLADNFDAWDEALPVNSAVPLHNAAGNPYSAASVAGATVPPPAIAQTVTPVHQRPGVVAAGPANTHNPVTGTGAVPVYHLAGGGALAHAPAPHVTVAPTAPTARTVVGAAAHRTTTVAAHGRGAAGVTSPTRTTAHGAAAHGAAAHAGRGHGHAPVRGRPGAQLRPH